LREISTNISIAAAMSTNAVSNIASEEERAPAMMRAESVLSQVRLARKSGVPLGAFTTTLPPRLLLGSGRR